MARKQSSSVKTARVETRAEREKKQEDRNASLAQYKRELRKHMKWRMRVHHEMMQQADNGTYMGIQNWPKEYQRRLSRDQQRLAEMRKELELSDEADQSIRDEIARDIGAK